jgi:ABC-2 type transport system permease protein
VIGLGSLIAIVVSHRALAGERETGTIKLLLTSPHSRRAVFLGKFVGRSTVALLPILAGLLLAGMIGLGRHTQFSPVTFLQFVTLTVSFVIAFVSVALALSTTTASGNEATAGAFGCYLVLGVGWPASTTLVKSVRNLVIEGTFTDTPQGQFENPDWFGLLDVASPAGAYRRLVGQWVQELPVSIGLTWEQSAPVAAISLAVWIIVPAILGYRTFHRLDLC